MLTRGKPLYKIYFEIDEQYKNTIRLSNLKDPPTN